MDQTWLQQRPHLRQLIRSLDEVLQLADEQYHQGRSSGDAVDYVASHSVVSMSKCRSSACGANTIVAFTLKHYSPSILSRYMRTV
jgi:hypothetical protein